MRRVRALICGGAAGSWMYVVTMGVEPNIVTYIMTALAFFIVSVVQGEP
jgi:hypothetical protein